MSSSSWTVRIPTLLTLIFKPHVREEIVKSVPSMQAKRKVKDLLEDDNDKKKKRKKPSPEPNAPRPMDKWLGAKKSSAEREVDEPPDESELQFTVNDDGTMSMS